MGKEERKRELYFNTPLLYSTGKERKINFVMMKTLLCLTTFIVAIHAEFPFQKDAALSDTEGSSVYGESTPGPFQETQEEPVRLSYPESNSMSEETISSQEDADIQHYSRCEYYSEYCDDFYRPDPDII